MNNVNEITEYDQLNDLERGDVIEGLTVVYTFGTVDRGQGYSLDECRVVFSNGLVLKAGGYEGSSVIVVHEPLPTT